MQKYISKTNATDIRYYEDDVVVNKWIDLRSYRPMTDNEIDQHENPKKYYTDEQKEVERLKQFLPLTRRQFKLTLLENGLLETIESKIDQIEDPKQKSRIQIEYLESEKFERQSESVAYMVGMLDLSTEQVDAMWLHAMSL